jgi:two-component system alkaline phosphatase synthesis response regulator PhoP
MPEVTTKKKVLIVDDEQSIRRVISEILKKDYDLVEAQNGKDAVYLARNQKPDVIVMDMIMPIMDGITACDQIRKEETTANIPIIMLTAIDHYLNRNIAENVGIDVYLTKPFNQHELLRTINLLIARSENSSSSVVTTTIVGDR